MKTLWFSIVTLLTVSIFSPGSCIKCYVCNSHVDENCTENYAAPNYLIDCNEIPAPPNFSPSQSDRCRKQEQWTKYHGTPTDHRFVRTCGYNQTGDRIGCVNKAVYYGAEQRVCTCLKEDGCNASASVYPAIILLLFSMFICLFTIIF